MALRFAGLGMGLGSVVERSATKAAIATIERVREFGVLIFLFDFNY